MNLHLHRHPANQARHDGRDRGSRIADAVTGYMGSWSFLGVQTVFITLWVGLNALGGIRHWDPYTFTLLNLIFSVQAAYAAPLILLAQNQQTEHDRIAAEHDYETNQKALALLEQLAHGQARIVDAVADEMPRTAPQ